MSQLVIDLNVSREEIEEDIEVLNVVNFGGGSYVLFAQIEDDEISVDSEPYSDNFARPARLLPLEAKALIAAIDLLGEYFPNDSLLTARKKVVTALGEDPATSGLQIAATQADDSEISTLISQAIQGHLLVEIEHYKEDQDTFTKRTIEPYSLMNGREGWYVHTWDREREAPRDFRLDRIKTADVSNETFTVRDGMMPDLDGWARSGTLSTGTTRKDLDQPRPRAACPRGVRALTRAQRRRNPGRPAVRRRQLARFRDLQVRRRRSRARAGRCARGSSRRSKGPQRGDRRWRSQGSSCPPPPLRRRPQEARRRGLVRGRLATMAGKRDQILLSDDEIAAYLEEQRTVIVGTNGPRGVPHLMPLWYIVRGKEIWGWTFTKSQKIKNLERDPRRRCSLRTASPTTSCAASPMSATSSLTDNYEVVKAVGIDLFTRYGDGNYPVDAVIQMIEQQVPKRTALRFLPKRTMSWDHRKLGGGY